MNSKTNTGGPAFPVHPEMADRLGCTNSASDAGMTLRDYFAAKAMQSFLLATDPTLSDGGKVTERHLAGIAYMIADAMLAAREAA